MPAHESPRPVVPVAAVYGGNAMGKSNLLHGFRFMREAVRASFSHWEPGSGVPRSPFRLDTAMLAEPSTFVVDLLLADGEYVYGFSVDDAEVVDEWLYVYRETNRKTVIFERSGMAVTLGDSLRKRATRTKLLTSVLRDNSLLLSVAMQLGEQPEFAPVNRWFRTSLRIRSPHWRTPPLLVDEVLHAKNRYPGYLHLVQAADLDISDVRVQETEEPVSESDEAFVDQFGEDIRKLQETLESNYFHGLRGWLATNAIDIKILEHAISNPCFEYWLLLHHTESAAPTYRCEPVADLLRKFVATYDRTTLRFDDFAAGVEAAISRAKRRDRTGKDHTVNPSSSVWVLVERLVNAEGRGGESD